MEMLGPKSCEALASTCKLPALLMDASNFGGPERVGESGVKPRRSLMQMRAS